MRDIYPWHYEKYIFRSGRPVRIEHIHSISSMRMQYIKLKRV